MTFDLKRLDIKTFTDDEGEVFLAYLDRECVGTLRIEPAVEGVATRCAVHTSVVTDLRRNGIASVLYDAAEAELAKLGQTLIPSHALSRDATLFWLARDQQRLHLVHPDRNEDYVQVDGISMMLAKMAAAQSAGNEPDVDAPEPDAPYAMR
ncbi:GNAT family N-acetyltransferase [Bosea sp. RAC05]|uniref:GNAT family N-acetyltransferase n=1 Tax=Bosea sp. RAC05 TaxID=1842539 RepID=UPI00083DBB71|nr:GNAT family N-acetyltransferase [Bosea sp. RAC05]AOG03380.1 hypothetical protein BSY19_5227 [Bosea sp. RAC05]